MARKARIKIIGVPETQTRLRSYSKEVKRQALLGWFNAGEKVMQRAAKRMPVEYGDMRDSAYVRRARTGGKMVEVGYTSEYAIFVHENMEAKLRGEPRPSGIGVYWGPNGEPRWLANTLDEMSNEMTAIVARYVKKAEAAMRRKR